MKMDCITISDDTSSTSKSSLPKSPSVVSLSTTIESHSDRCSDTRNSNGKQKCIVPPQLVNNASVLNNRVDLWVASTMHLEQSLTSSHHISLESSDIGSNSSSKNDSFIPNKYDFPKRNILIRHDFDKDGNLASNIQSHKSNWIYTSDNTLNGFHGKKDLERCLEPNINSFIVENVDYEEATDTGKYKHKFNNNEVPLSPESQKKNELCSYLQLMNMNCADQKMASKIQNRRSTRVKNLIIMSEKKELERKLNSEALEKEKDCDKECTTSISVDNEKKIFLSKPSVEFNSDLEKEHCEKSQSEERNTLKLLNIQNIPRKILEERVDFDDVIKSLIPTEQCDSETKNGEEEKTVTQLRISSKNYKYTRKRKKYTNGNLKNLPELSKLKSRLIHSRKPNVQSNSHLREHNNKLTSFPKHSPHLKKNKSQLKQDSLARNKHIKRIALRHSGRQNLRSRVSLSGVGIKTLILKDRKKHIKVKSSHKKSLLSKVQKKSSSCSLSSTLIENVKSNKELTFSTEKTIDNKKNVRELVKKLKNTELVSNVNMLNIKPQLSLNSKIEKIDGLEKEIVKEKINNSLEEIESHSEMNGTKIVEMKTKERVRTDMGKAQGTTKISEDHKNSFKEKPFIVIDLSHSKPSATVDTLNDHNYTLKPPTEKGYIMNVVLGANERSPIMETVENNSIGDICCRSPEMPSGCKDGEYCKEMLEEIIGIPWKHMPKKANKNKEEDSNNANNAYMENCKDVMVNQNDTTPQHEYNSSQDSLLLNANSSSKMFNIRLPLLEPPTNIFDDGPCSPPLERSVEVLHVTPSKSLTFNNEHNCRPRVISMGVPPEIKSLHKSLMHGKRKVHLRNSDLYGESSNHIWENDNSCEDKRSHSIRISSTNGNVMNAFYVDFNLVIVQEQLVSFWSQSALGNMLGSQDMWIYKGSVQRLLLDSNCVHKESSDMVISLENSFAYVELWIKEHKSDKRERPLADVFATVYFWRHRQNVPDKKVLQLENINGKGGDVQYIVLRNSRNIVVSWIEIRDDLKKTVVHCYCLAADYQTVVDIRELDTVDHCVTSLHNIEDCNNMVMGFGEENVTLWNLEYGYVVATIEIKSATLNPRCVWVKCDRGFLFILQHHQIERLLVLIAINGVSHSWKRLQVFRAPFGYDGLRGVCIDNNVLAAFYQRGVLCWNIQSGESVIEEMSSLTTYIPCDKHIVMLNSEKVQVQQFLSYFITSFDLQ